VIEDVREWQQRPLDDVYPVVFLDALVLKIREGGTVQRRACYLALGVTVEGERDVLGMWFQETEGAKFWMQVLSELKQRGVNDKWGSRFPVITQAWLNAWEYVTPFLAFPPELRRVVYTTNAIEALNRQLRKAIKTKGHFPNEEAARNLIYLAIVNAVPAWTRTRNWTTALLAFKIHFGHRLPK
jgi:putative transposase